MKVQLNDLQRGLKSRHISLIALGGIIGSSYFLGTGYIVNQVGPCAFLAYILGGVISFITIACLAELAMAIPMPGSFVSYATKFISPSWACGVGWSYWISWVVYIPSECLAAGILMNHFIPEVSEPLWTIAFGLIITIVNLSHVKNFGEIEFWLSLIKIGLLIGFSFAAALILFSLIGPKVPLGTEYLLGHGGLFPNGYLVFFINMVVLLANFQGSEIIGLSAAEAENPHHAIPSALKKIAFRIMGLYLIPTLLLVMIFPWQKANLSGSVFAVALNSYGFRVFAKVFAFLIIAGAISCANSGLYATVRALFALSQERMAPKSFTEVSSHGIPIKATLVTLGVIWFLIVCSLFLPSHSFYANLLAMSGFTGTMCWISICWSQYRFRKSITSSDATLVLPYKIKGFPFLTLACIWAQVLCLLIVVLSPQLRSAFYLGVPSLLIPILWYRFLKRKRSN